ncbi:hypothetical protein Aca07nite_87960 [Actinoplanes capillaceus]|uniref:dTDP-4-amino-4,6-dideoxygalactose transaminase n=1 Tax=Actinoplanes campanulatus TaxID=113559 RepID=A0ABQ3WZA6_9ACTN|nr:DegT/DnrJ/EryC1/StrS family aminotransferase [Actinoplanes capillaceus]GID51521.1 hypothetical protein Aca07nite_87960 [Actinoplanes capillaceus]
MTSTDVGFDRDHPVPDRYTVPDCGELDAMADALSDGMLSGGASIVTEYEQALADWLGVRRVIAVSSGTAALHATLVTAGVRPGDEVLLPATAPLPTAMPVLTCGAVPVIVDTLPGSLALDPDDVRRKVSARTRSAITLPLWGYPADDTAARGVLADAGVPVIEDACQAHGTQIAGRPAGTHGLAGCFSTHDRKLLATGEGGFIVTDDEDFAERVDHYTHLGHLKGGHGVNYKLAAPLAAIGLRRLAVLDHQLAARRGQAERIMSHTKGVLAELGYRDGDTPNYYSLVLVAPRAAQRIAAELAAAGLAPDSIRFGYRPLYHQPLFQNYATWCPNAEHLTATTLQLPVHPALPPETLDWIGTRVATLAGEPS